MDYKAVKDLLEKYIEGESSIKEEERLRDYFQETEDVPKDLLYAKSMFTVFKQEAIVEIAESKVNAVKPICWLSGLAAGIAILIGILWLNTKSNTELITKHNNRSEPREIKIGKNFNVWLNTGAEISYRKKAVGFVRKIEVKGEVFFEIGNDSLMNSEIYAENALINAQSNTSFNVNALPDKVHIDITVKEGAVNVMEVNHSRGLALLVIEGHYCSVHKEHKMVFSSNNKNDNYLAWKTGELVFNNQPMANVAEVLERYYNVTVKIEDKNLAYCEFSGKFQDKSVDYVLKTIQNDLAVECFKNGEVINISGNRCLPE